MAGDTAKDVYLCKSVQLQLTGGGEQNWEPPVSSVTISLQASDIPTASIIIDPAHEANADADSSDVSTAISGTIGNLKDWNDRVQAVAADPKNKATLTITIEPASSTDGGITQSVTLKDWLVIAGGIGKTGGGASAAGQFALDVTLQHPAGNLDRVMPAMGSKDTPIWGHQAYENPITGTKAAWTALIDYLKRKPPQAELPPSACASDMPNALTISEVWQAVYESSGKIVEKMTDYLEWQASWPENAANYSSLPFEHSCFEGDQWCLNGVRYALTAVAQNPEDKSLWDAFIHELALEWQLTLVPTYWQNKLTVMPHSPWALPAITVNDDQISNIVFPGVDPAPIGGVQMYYTTTKDPLDATWYNGNDAEGGNAVETSVLFAVMLDGEPIGRILKYRAPSWLQAAWQGDAAAAGRVTAPAEADANGTLLTAEGVMPSDSVDSSNTGDAEARKGMIAGAAYLCAAQMFLASYRAEVEGSVSTCLLIRSDFSKWPEGYVIPGCVARIQAVSPEKPMFDMYLTGVTHYLNAATGEASTMLTGKHCRDTAKGESAENAIPEGTYNPIY